MVSTSALKYPHPRTSIPGQMVQHVSVARYQKFRFFLILALLELVAVVILFDKNR
jgi:hypothetical protein